VDCGWGHAVIQEVVGACQSAALDSGPPPVGETCSSLGGFVSSPPQRYRARPAWHKAPQLLRVLPDGLLSSNTARSSRRKGLHCIDREGLPMASRRRRWPAKPGGRERRHLRASEGQDDRSERPARGCGQPRACAPDEPAASRPVGFIETILFDTTSHVEARKVCQGSPHDPYSPQAFSLHPADDADRIDDGITPASTVREGQPCFGPLAAANLPPPSPWPP